MPLSFTFNGTDIQVVESFQFKSSRVVNALVEKMEAMMVKLQEKMQSKTKGRVADSVRDPEAFVEGGKIVGTLKVGGEPTTVSYKGGRSFDIAQILDKGAVPHRIDPLLRATGLTGPGQPRGGTRLHEKGAVRRFGANVLQFYSIKLGREVYASALYGTSEHPGITGSHFIEDSIDEMRGQIRDGLMSTLQQVVISGGR